MNDIHIHIFSQTEITNNILKEMRIVSFYIQPYKHNGKLRKGFDILSTIFKLVGSSNLRFNFFKYLDIFVNIFVFVHQKNYLLHSELKPLFNETGVYW